MRGGEGMEIKEILETQLETLYERFGRTSKLEEICALNKEIRETAKVIIEMESTELIIAKGMEV